MTDLATIEREIERRATEHGEPWKDPAFVALCKQATAARQQILATARGLPIGTTVTITGWPSRTRWVITRHEDPDEHGPLVRLGAPNNPHHSALVYLDDIEPLHNAPPEHPAITATQQTTLF